MMPYCPYCMNEVQEWNISHREVPNRNAVELTEDSIAESEDIAVYDQEEYVKLMPCGHSFPAKKLEKVAALHQKVHRMRTDIEIRPRYFSYVEKLEDDYNDLRTQLQLAINEANAYVEGMAND